MLNYREKYGDDPQPNERGSENLKNVASVIIEKCELGNTVDHLLEYALVTYSLRSYQWILEVYVRP